MAEQSAFDQLYAVTSAQLYEICRTIAGDEAAAAQAVEATYVRIWEEPDAFRVEGVSAVAWLVSLARNKARAARPEDQCDKADLPGDGELIALVFGQGIEAPEAVKVNLDRQLFVRLSLGRTLLRWALGAVFGAAAAGAVAFVGLTYVIPAMTQTVWEVQLTGAAGYSFSARYESADGSLSVARVAGQTLPGRDQQVWLVVPGEMAVPLGLLDGQGRLVADLSVVPPEILAQAGLAVSSEPLGGSSVQVQPSDILASTQLRER